MLLVAAGIAAWLMYDCLKEDPETDEAAGDAAGSGAGDIGFYPSSPNPPGPINGNYNDWPVLNEPPLGPPPPAPIEEDHDQTPPIIANPGVRPINPKDIASARW